MFADKNKVMGCLMGGAIGDAFGAPVEAIFKLEELIAKHGKSGLQEFVYYKSPWDDAEREGVGIITDDTTITACTFAGLIETPRGPSFIEQSLDLTWRYYMLWGQQQKFGDVIAQSATVDTVPPDYLKPFLFRCGAGLGTLGGLSAGYRGTLEKSLEYDVIIDNKKIKSPNKGCGSVMRAAAIAVMFDEMNIITYAAQNAAITHGDDDAIAATIGMTMLIANAFKYNTLAEALRMTKIDFQRVSNANLQKAWFDAEEAFKANKFDMEAMDKLGRSDPKVSPFLAMPVLTQVLFAVQRASVIEKPTSGDFVDISRFAVNHTCDSDSVGALVGNVIGASWGYDILPQRWVDQIQQKDDILKLCDVYLAAAQKANLKNDR